MASDLGRQILGLTQEINSISDKFAVKAFRAALSASVTPTVKKMRLAAPQGEEPHRTYKKRLVAGGFSSRSIRKQTKTDKKLGKIVVSIGVTEEAFYSVAFLDKGIDVSQRKGKNIKPYTIKPHPFFKGIFENDESAILSHMTRKLRSNIRKFQT